MTMPADIAAPNAAPPFPDMVWIPGATYKMGSDKHYPEERPVHRVSVDGFWIDRFPVTNERFARFVEARFLPIPRSIPARCLTCCIRDRSCSSDLTARSIAATSPTGGSS